MLLFLALLLGCPKAPAEVPAPETTTAEVTIDIATPQATFETLRAAIERRDLDAYTACFTEAARLREAGVHELERDPGGWAELEAVFRGPQKLELEKPPPDEVGATWPANVVAPEAEGGGIGGMTFERTTEGWQVATW